MGRHPDQRAPSFLRLGMDAGFVHIRLLETNIDEIYDLMLFSSDAVEDVDDVDWARR